jgi:hypothetical protein
MKAPACMFRDSLVAALCLAAGLLPAAHVDGQNAPPAQESAKVVGRLPLPGIHVNQMFVQREDKRILLYLHRPNKRAFAVADVTKPEKPALLDVATLQGPSPERMDVSAANPSLGIAVTPEEHAVPPGAQTNAAPSAAPITLPTETIKILDLNDPAHPKVLLTFAGVTSMLPDDNRKLIYIVNNEGLWIVRHRQSRPMPFCTSEDAIIQHPNCQ